MNTGATTRTSERPALACFKNWGDDWRSVKAKGLLMRGSLLLHYFGLVMLS